MGIYQNKYKVYHFHKTGKRFAIVCTTLADFSNGRSISVHCEPDNKKHADEIIARAEKAFRNKR